MFYSLRARTAVMAATALTGAALSLGTAPGADADTSSGGMTYDCTTSTGTTVQIHGDFALTLPSAPTAGVPIGPGTPFTLGLDPTALQTLLNTLGTGVLATNYAINGLSATLGGTPVTNAVTNPLLTILGTGLIGVGGTLGGFTPTGTGSGLPVPDSFNLLPTVLGLPVPGAGAISCHLEAGSTTPVTITSSNGSTSTVGVAKQKATVKAHQVRHLRVVAVKVKNQMGRASGKVVAKSKGRRVGAGTLKNGRLRLHLKHLGSGAHRVRILYLGDATTGAGHRVVRVKVAATSSR